MTPDHDTLHTRSAGQGYPRLRYARLKCHLNNSLSLEIETASPKRRGRVVGKKLATVRGKMRIEQGTTVCQNMVVACHESRGVAEPNQISDG